MRSSWENARTEFNHDWLKNRFLPPLSKALNLIDNEIEDALFEELFITSIFSEWELKRKDAEKLIRGFSQEASPKVIFYQKPLLQLDENTKKWLSNIVHNLWLNRYQIEYQTRMAMQALNETNKSYSILQERLKTKNSTRDWRYCRNELAEFRRNCQKLADVVTSFRGVGKVV